MAHDARASSVQAERVAVPDENRMGKGRKLVERSRPSLFSSGVVAIASEMLPLLQ